MQSSVLSVILFCCLLVPALGQTADSTGAMPKPHPEFADYAMESAAGFGCGCGASLLPLGAAYAMLIHASWGEEDYTGAVLLTVLGAATYVGGSAAAASWAGNRMGWSGSPSWSLVLASGTAVAAGLLAYPTGGLSMYAGVIGVPVMAAVGYNIGATRREPRTSWETRLAPPSLSAHVERSREGDGRQSVTCDAKLLTVRF